MDQSTHTLIIGHGSAELNGFKHLPLPQ